jgi:formylglycine-generating enzyme required for sulfatase activity/DNA-binding winged helix-turn-helix (wHTH) protein/dienelactone hydrolase
MKMRSVESNARVVRFRSFSLHLDEDGLRKEGRLVKLHPQPVRLLALLVSRPGEIVTRDEIKQALWENDTHVDFDLGINSCIRQIRTALEDDADHPRFIETVPKKGYRFIAQKGARAQAESTGSLLRPRWAVPASIVLMATISVGGWYWRQASSKRWARETVLPQIENLAEEGNFVSAFRMAGTVEPLLPENPRLNDLMQVISHPFTVETKPPGAEVYFKPYSSPDDDWELMGISPISNASLPVAYLRFRVVKEGFVTAERTRSSVMRTLRLSLDPEESSPRGMVHVPGGTPRLGKLSPVSLDDYWLDKYEVTNQDYKRFIDAGGYHQRKFWKQPFVKDGKTIPWEEAIHGFRDQTGRPGPATWELGTYLEGEEDYPVRGVSWYEAAAYAEFAGKSLPTIYHWYRASRSGGPVDILTLGNFSNEKPAKVGTHQGPSRFGNYDMAGNVKEWCWNETHNKRFILGGAWNEPSYLFHNSEYREPMDRSPSNGFRCARFDNPLPEAAMLATGFVDSFIYDYRAEEPVEDEVYEAYRSFYSYDRTPLNATIESSDASSPWWYKERVLFDAAYDDERVVVHLFIPKKTPPPYQAVVYFPGVEGMYLKALDDIAMQFFDFIVRSGRVVAYPIYKGMHERGPRLLMSNPSAHRDQIIHQYKDLARCVDYLETRKDMNREKLAYCGFSLGAIYGPIFTALEPRLKASVQISGGFVRPAAPEVHPLHFAPRSKTPTLMLNGGVDFGFPLETSQIPMFRLLGASEENKQHVIFDSGHIPPRTEMIRETLDWLDKYLGSVK